MSPRTARIRSLRPLRRAPGTPCTGSARTRMSPPRRPGGPRCLGVPMGSRRGRTRSSQDVSGHTIVGLPGELPVRRARSRVTSISCRNGQRDSGTIRRSPRSCPRDRRDRGSPQSVVSSAVVEGAYWRYCVTVSAAKQIRWQHRSAKPLQLRVRGEALALLLRTRCSPRDSGALELVAGKGSPRTNTCVGVRLRCFVCRCFVRFG